MTDTTTTESKTRRLRNAASKSGNAVASQAASKSNAPEPAEAAPKRQTKASMVAALLARKEGVTLDAMCAATGWQAHTCRAFLTGLRKKGMAVTRDNDAVGTTIYKLGETKEREVAS